MQAMHLLVAAVISFAQGRVTAPAAPKTPRFPVDPGMETLAGLEQQLKGLASLQSLEGLQGLDLDGLELSSDDQDDQDPADSLWRAAQRAFNRSDYTNAASLFLQIQQRYPNAHRAGDALYWAAFGLYRTGDAQNLRKGRDLLNQQAVDYPRAATRRDALGLMARIQSTLASQGDASAAEWLSTHAANPAARAPRAPRGATPPTAAAPPTGAVAPSAAAAPSARGCPNEDDEDDIRVAALNGLLQMDAANAVPILKTVLAKRDACSAGLRRKAVFLISQKRTDETEDILLDVARHDPDSEVRQQAVFWLSQVPSDRAVSMLDSILRESTDEELQDKAIFALSQQHSPRAGQILRAYAERADASIEARSKAIFWLGQQRGAENAAYLRSLYAKLTDEELKDKVIFSVSQMGGADNLRWLMDIALNEREDIEMRKKALFWAGQSNGTDLAQLTGLYDRIQSEEMKEQLIFVYSQRKESAALEKLMDIARRDPNRELRKKALFWIGQSHDPRAARFLLEIINQ